MSPNRGCLVDGYKSKVTRSDGEPVELACFWVMQGRESSMIRRLN